MRYRLVAFLGAWLWVAFPAGAIAQNVVLSVGSGSAAAGGTVALAINIASTNGTPVSAVQWSFSYSADVTGFSVTPGSAATGAQKSVACTGNTCLAYGPNTESIANGILAVATFRLASKPSGPAIPIQISAVTAASPSATGIPGTGGSGLISLLPSTATLNGLTCATITISTPGNTTCTVVLAFAAPAGGFPVGLSSGPNLMVPAGVTIAAGATEADFTAVAAGVNADLTVSVTANAGGVAQTALLTLLAPVGLRSVSCMFSTLAGTGSTLCTAWLNRAPSSPLTVSLSSNNAALIVPDTVMIAPGQAAAGFLAVAGTVTSAQMVTVTASLNPTQNQSIAFNISLVPKAVPGVAGPGILNSASFATGAGGEGLPVAVGSLVSIFGANLGTTAMSASAFPLPAILAGVQVTFDAIPAPLAFVSPTQINAQVPFELLAPGLGSVLASVVVTVDGVSSTPALLQVVQSSPGVFSLPAGVGPAGVGPAGVGNAALQSAVDGALAAAAPEGQICGCSTRAIHPGENAFFYATGLGHLTPPMLDGFQDLARTHAAVTTPVVLIGGIPAQVTFAGQAPQYPGVDQINVVIPANAPAGDNVPLQVQAGGITSTDKVTVAIGPGP